MSDNGNVEMVKRWAILLLDSSPFSDNGDLGSIIVNSHGHISGLLIAGTASTGSTLDVTYATPIGFILKLI